ncbi:serine/threonine-protein kinase [Homoserinibacter sp. GY 40078]|uniref:serine/threonine-protein kinase n=1 Tax=Homoserinibacter sp. GY 40078 TaxID=2603275 RepID=UPI0011C8E045|nr:serine/threonine-protein kinase [Homoserinibacter sp. GY 40078]TXK18887.1 serine/threonine protein kinase [Homoserinibacter sp. GY 40078]
MRPTSGLTFGGRYQLSSRIAIGGMGEVWQATDLVIGRTVAIKILKDEYLGDPGFLERFRAEARHAALVNHEGIANVFDYGEEDGSAYLVMELVPGEALSTVLERERVLSTDRVLDIVAQTASALQAAHSAGLVHRDIKPGNLLITPDGRVKITDFGIARIADQVPLTATGQVMGTVQYLSPEQASGHPASPSTDIYSLGIVAYEALAGRRPFTGESQVAIAMAQINETPPDLPVTVSEPVRNLVYSCIAKRPEDRPATAAHLARAAQALRRGDIAGAAAAVPGIAGGAAALTSATMMATRVLPTAEGEEGEATEETKRRSPWMWPLIAIVSLLAVALIAIIIVIAVQPQGGDGEPSSPPPSTPSQTPSDTPSATPTEATTVRIVREDYLGLSYEDALQKLEDSGGEFSINRVTGPAAQTPDQVGTVQDITPVGNVTKGSSITLTVWDEMAPLPQPTTPTADPSNGNSGDTISIEFPSYEGCPKGYARTGYRFTLTNATASSTDLNAGAKSIDIVLGDPGQTAAVSYVATCKGDLESPQSQTLEVPINP